MLKNLKTIIASPTSIAALIGILVIVIVLMKIRKVHITTKITAQIGIALALATVLKMFKLFHLPFGGSVTIGSMVPILLIALLYGPELGFLTGFLFGIITLILDPCILHPVQVLFDYPLPFMALGLAGYFRKNKYVACIIAIFVRYVCHVISGVVFFASDAPKGTSPLVYSLTYNCFVWVDAVICIIIIALIPLKQLTKSTAKYH